MSEEKWRYASRPRPFWPWLLGFALVLCAVGAAGLAVLWGALERYEAATPEAAILRSVKAVLFTTTVQCQLKNLILQTTV